MKDAIMVLMLAAGLVLAGCKASQPGETESSFMRGVKQKITIGGKDWKNPLPDDDATAKEGGEHFQHHCQICHGLDGHNTGVPFAEKMAPPVADLGSKFVQEYSDGQLKWVIENGIEPSGMPAWKGTLDDDEMWKVVRYIRHLPAKGSLGAPAIYKEGEEAHEKLEKGRAAAGTKPSEHHHH